MSSRSRASTPERMPTRPRMAAVEDVATERIATSVETEREVSRRWFIGLLLALAAALPLLLWWGRDQWFFLDEWEFLVNRRAGDISSLFEPHNGHWVTVPLILYRID